MSAGPESLRSELMDDPALPYGEAARALADLGRVHRRFGNGALWRALMPQIRRGPSRQRLLDIGTGTGEIAAEASRRARKQGVVVRVFGVDRKLAHLVIGRSLGVAQRRVVADACELPFRDGTFDCTASTLFQHHFGAAQGRRVLVEARRVASGAAVVSDLRRSFIGRMLGSWVIALLRLGPIATFDGRLSLEQAWSLDQAREAVPAVAIASLSRRWPFRWSMVLRPIDAERDLG